MVNEIPDNGIISPHAICDSCGKNSGPVLKLPEFPDLSDFLRKNVVPVGLERQMTLQDIGTAEEKISQLDVEINRLKQVLESLRQQRDELRDFRVRGKSLFAPIRKLPEDVLRHIFIICQRAMYDGFIQVYYKKKTFIKTIMNVCEHWRQVARSSPELWCKISVWMNDRPPKHISIEPFLDACITFSRETPLCVRILPDLGDSCIRSIARCAYRWKEIDIRSGELFSEIMKYVDPDLVLLSLERLSVADIASTLSINPSPALSYFHAGREPESSELVTVSFKSAPGLRNLCIENVHHPMSTFVDLPWGQVTTFKSALNEYDENELARLLKLMPNLISFTLDGKPNMIETVTLPSLKAFTSPSEAYMPYDGNVLDAFTAPYVEKLYLESDMDPTSVFEFLTRSCCPLVDLKLADTLLNREWLETCSSLRTVKTLCLVVPDLLWNDILTLKIGTNLSHITFPQLQSLELRWVVLEDDRNFSDVVQPLIHMLKSRIAPIQRSAGLEGDRTLCYLQHITIIFTEYLTQQEKKAFYELNRSDLVRQSGVIINICHDQDYSFIIRNGIAVDEGSTDSDETSSYNEDNMDSDNNSNSSYDTNTDPEDTSTSGDESSE